ncbi:diacylglycerol/lipid kinase family protein [Verrucomicrobiota bacterium sgz303538]
MVTPKTLILLNPAAGSAGDMDTLLKAVGELQPGTAVRRSKGPGDIKLLAHEAATEGFEVIVAAGGDGTLNEVLNGISDYFGQVALGLLPLGTGNDFARTVNVPDDLDHALAVLREGRTQKIDVLKVSTPDTRRYMVNVSAGGFSSKVSEISSDVKDTWGPLCYARSLLGALPELDDYHTSIRLDDKEVVSTPAYNVVVANARYVAGGIPIAPDASLDDGLADVIVLPVASLPELAAITSTTLLGKHLSSDKVLFRRARKIEVTSTPPMRFNTDGELLPAGPVTFEVLPRVLDFIVGPQPVQARS